MKVAGLEFEISKRWIYTALSIPLIFASGYAFGFLSERSISQDLPDWWPIAPTLMLVGSLYWFLRTAAGDGSIYEEEELEDADPDE